MIHDMTEGGQIGAEHIDERVSKQGIVREVGVGLILSVETAASIVGWLQDKINLINKLKAPPEPGKETNESSVH